MYPDHPPRPGLLAQHPCIKSIVCAQVANLRSLYEARLPVYPGLREQCELDVRDDMRLGRDELLRPIDNGRWMINFCGPCMRRAKPGVRGRRRDAGDLRV